MADYTLNKAGQPVFPKDPNATLDYSLDFTDWLTQAGDSIASVLALPVGCTLAQDASFTGGVVTAFVSGGVVDEDASVTFRVTTTSQPPRVDDRTVILKIKER
jgi:hypothetical protein